MWEAPCLDKTEMMGNLKTHLQATIQAIRDLSGRQYGFIKGPTTVDAIKKVVQAVEESNHYSKEIVLLVTLDVKNTYNSARWGDMLEVLEVFKISEYLLCKGNTYCYTRQRGTQRSWEVMAGAAQGPMISLTSPMSSYCGWKY